MLMIEGHAIVTVDGMIADRAGEYPEELKNEADWAQYQRALDGAVVVVTGRRGHERHPNPGRNRLVLTHRVPRMGADPNDKRATYWNPAGLSLHQALAAMGVTEGLVAITGVFDLFIADYMRFVLSESNKLLIPDGTPCFAAGHPRAILAGRGLKPVAMELIDPDAMVTTTTWER